MQPLWAQTLGALPQLPQQSAMPPKASKGRLNEEHVRVITDLFSQAIVTHRLLQVVCTLPRAYAFESGLDGDDGADSGSQDEGQASQNDQGKKARTG